MTTNRVLALLGGVLAAAGLAAGMAGGPLGGQEGGPGAAPGAGPGVAELTAELEAGRAAVDAVTLGQWIRDRRAGLVIVDVRDSSSFIRYAIPTARHLRLPQLADSLDGDAEIVLYDDGGSDAARAWLLLRRLGYPRVRILEHGVLGWIDGVMSPVLPAATSGQKRRFDEVAAVSRYFGGVPRAGLPGESARGPASTREAVELLTRRGCY